MCPALLLCFAAAGPLPAGPAPAAPDHHLEDEQPAAEKPIITRVKAAMGEEGEGKPFLLVVSLTAKPGRGAELIEAYRGAAAKSLAEPGCTSYALTRDAENPDAFLLYERWKSTEALASHLNQPYTKAFVGAFGGLLADSSVTVMKPVPPRGGPGKAGGGAGGGAKPRKQKPAADAE